MQYLNGVQLGQLHHHCQRSQCNGSNSTKALYLVPNPDLTLVGEGEPRSVQPATGQGARGPPTAPLFLLLSAAYHGLQTQSSPKSPNTGTNALLSDNNATNNTLILLRLQEAFEAEILPRCCSAECSLGLGPLCVCLSALMPLQVVQVHVFTACLRSFGQVW